MPYSNLDRRGIDREEYGDFFGTELRHDEDKRNPGRFRNRRGPMSNFARQGWPGFGAEGDWEGGRNREGGFGRGLSWGQGGDYGRGADWRPFGGERESHWERSRDPRRQDPERGEGRGGEGAEWEHYGGRGYWQDYGWGANWPRHQIRENYGWEGRPGGYGESSGFSQFGRFAGRGPKGYQRSDERIREDVSELLMENGELDASNLEVHVENGVVTLKGSTDSRYTKRLAEDLADSVPGVKDVRNELRVQSATFERREAA